MTDFMAQNRCQLCLIIHQGHQLPGDVNIAAGDRKGVVHGGIEQRHGEFAWLIGKPRRGGDGTADPRHIIRLWPGIEPAKFLQKLRMGLGAFGLILGRHILRRRCAR